MKTHFTKFRLALISTVTHFLISTLSFAQAPQKMSYQAVIRDASNNLVASKTVGMKISILQASATGNAVYTETLTPTTNANGLVAIEIGNATGFSSIDWSTATYFIKTETDPTGGTNYTITGTSQLLSVPYALYAKTAGSIGSTFTLMKDTLPMSLYIGDDGTMIAIPIIKIESPCVATPTITDADGNSYSTVKIGSQVWMQSNLRTTKYNDGIVIPNVKNNTWNSLTTPAVCSYNNTSNNDTINIYGRLYNWYAVNTGKLCPTGWHVPSFTELTVLVDYLGKQGGRMKEKGTQHWNSPNINATNDSKFTALPGGNMGSGGFMAIGNVCQLWSSSEFDAGSASFLQINSNPMYTMFADNTKISGYSVRCLKN